MIRDAQGCQMLRAGSFMGLSPWIWNQRLVRPDVERMPRVAAVGHPEADQRCPVSRTDAVSSNMTSSMHHDLERGNRLEALWLCRAVVDTGARHGFSNS